MATVTPPPPASILVTEGRTRPRLVSTLIAERDGLIQDIINSNAKIAELELSPRWNESELHAAYVFKRSFRRTLIRLADEIDEALEREVRNMEWLLSLSQVSSWNPTNSPAYRLIIF
jgi:hypothetical protein